MTTPVSLPVVVPGLADGQASTPGATDDVFAAVLAALSGALGVPVQQVPQHVDVPVPAEESGRAGSELPAATGPVAWAATTQRHALHGLAATASGEPVPRGPVPTAGVPATPAPVTPAAERPLAAPATAVGMPSVAAPVGPAQPMHGTAVRATTPAGVHAPFGDLGATQARTRPVQVTEAPTTPAAEEPAVPVGVATPSGSTAPQPDAAAPLAATTAVAAAQPPAPAALTEQPAPVGATRHVQPAVVEAASSLRHEGGGRTSLVVRLDPPELGAVLVRLTVQDGRVDVQLRTPDLAARADLQAQSYDVQQVLREQGFDLSSFEVTYGDVFSSAQGDAPDRGTPQHARPADGRTGDPRVTDDADLPDRSGTWL
jgi:chemotaxis protein MotD